MCETRHESLGLLGIGECTDWPKEPLLRQAGGVEGVGGVVDERLEPKKLTVRLDG
jgi:hypothetical protein